MDAFDLVCGELKLFDSRGRKEPLRSFWATVDHFKPLNQGGTDCLENLVACCVLCNSQIGDGEKRSLLPVVQHNWFGYGDYFLALMPKVYGALSKTDRDWGKALRWAGVEPTSEDPMIAISVLRAE